MPQNITDSATYTATIVAPSDGDDLDADSILTGLQGLSNRTAYLATYAAATRAGVLGLASSKVVSVPIVGLTKNSSDRFGFVSLAPAVVQQTDVTSAGAAVASLVIPAIAGEITAATIYRQGGTGHGGAQPGTLPVVELYRYNPVSAVTQGITSITDNTSGANWETVQPVTQMTITSGIIDPAQTYFLTIAGEDGANKFVGWSLLGVLLTIEAL